MTTFVFQDANDRSELDRKKSEYERIESEKQKALNEIGRVNNETSRQNAEAERVIAEEERKNYIENTVKVEVEKIEEFGSQVTKIENKQSEFNEMISKSKNFIDEKKLIQNEYINHVYDTTPENSRYKRTDYIYLKAGSYTGNFITPYYNIYDKNKNVVRNGNESKILTLEKDGYVRLTFLSSNEQCMLNEGEIELPYEKYYVEIRKEYIPQTTIDDLDLKKIKIDIDQCTFSENKNLYDKDKKYITGDSLGDLGIYTCTTPENAYFLRNTCTINQKNEMMIVEGESLPSKYYEFGYKIPSKYIENEENNKEILINLPSKLYALVGQEFNIYFDNIVEGKDIEYAFDVSCNIGMQMERCYRVVPTEKGEYNFNVKVFKNDKLVGNKSTKIIVSGTSQGTGITKKILVLGDSTTNSGITIQKLNENFSSDVMKIKTLGTRGNSPNNHEGRSGWTFEKYFTVYQDSGALDVLNPFYNQETSTFDYNYYCANSGIEQPDYFFVNLGINDTFNYSNDIELKPIILKMFERLDYMINDIHKVNSNIKIGIVLTIPPNYNQDAFGKAYKCNQYRDRYKRNNILLVNEMIKKYDNRESEKLYLIPLHCNLDTKYNFGMEQIKVNARNDVTYNSPIANGGVHPDVSGYWQCADSYWYFLKSLEN